MSLLIYTSRAGSVSLVSWECEIGTFRFWWLALFFTDLLRQTAKQPWLTWVAWLRIICLSSFLSSSRDFVCFSTLSLGSLLDCIIHFLSHSRCTSSVVIRTVFSHLISFCLMYCEQSPLWVVWNWPRLREELFPLRSCQERGLVSRKDWPQTVCPSPVWEAVDPQKTRQPPIQLSRLYKLMGQCSYMHNRADATQQKPLVSIARQPPQHVKWH